MYKPYISESESGSGSDSDNDIITHWHNAARAHLPVPKRTLLPGYGDDVPDDEPVDTKDTGTCAQFEERYQTTVVMVSSLDRDQHVYPFPTQMRLKLPREYKNVERIDIVQIKFFSGLYWVTARNNSLTVQINGISYTASLTPGSYSLSSLCSVLQTSLNTAVTIAPTTTTTTHSGTTTTTTTTTPIIPTLSVLFSPITGRITISCSVQFNIIFPTTNVYSEWGLGWNLGWGGPPVSQTDLQSYTADNFPRIGVDYIYLQLNDTEHMNSIDHTDVEATGRVQDSTGQVSHYFGKLLLNNFGSWAQTFIESPNIFSPVLGRLDRLNFTWTDRHGIALTTTGVGAESCDWHMTLRITEIVEVPIATSSLIQSSSRKTKTLV
jgi:hypothetical protein